MSNDAYGWMPGFLRRFLNLDDETPNDYRSSSSSYGYRSYNDSYSAPRAQPQTNAQPMNFPTAPTEFPTTPTKEWVTTEQPFPPVAGLPDASQLQGYTQPISHLVKGYVRGALPPQGLEQFAKEVRGTTQQLGDFYGYWIRFQTDEIGKLIRVFNDAVFPQSTPAEQLTHVKVEMAPSDDAESKG